MPMVTEIDTGAYRQADHAIDPMFIRRWSPRAMSGEAVSPEELMVLFEAARWAPSSYNGQPWRFLYARRDSPHWQPFFELMVEFNQAWAQKAAVLIVVLSRRVFEHNGEPNRHHSFDAGSAWQSLALQGSLMGLVVHAMAGFDADRARRSLQVPAEYEVEAMIAVGKPGRSEDLPEALREGEVPSDRKPVAEIACAGPFAL